MYDISDLGRSMDKLTHTINETSNDMKDNSSMNDIAGLLALLQGNRGMDIPGLLALCKDRGYQNSFGESFMFIFLLLILFANGGWNGLNGTNRAAFQELAGTNCNTLTGLYDRIYAGQAETAQGFLNLDSKLCTSIASVINSVRDQGDRTYEASRNVGDTVRDCCCKMEAMLASITCKIDGVSRDIRENTNLLSAKVELEALKAENARAAMECRLTQTVKDCCCETEKQFAELKCMINNNRLADENARLARENENLRDSARGRAIAESTAEDLRNFMMAHWTPTRTA